MKRILFVDDEPNLLDGLQRMLRPQRQEWEMRFALGAQEALRALEREPVDVIVTDMRMPGMDGAELLRKVHDHYPGVIRILLSGHFDVEAGLRLVPVAHQFLSKPCEPSQLKAAIERSAPASDTVADEVTKQAVGALGVLPSPPKTCGLLIDAMQDPGVSIESICRIINQDVAITAKILQLVNTGFFGLPRQETSIQSAVNRLGMDVLKQLVMSAAILRTFHPTAQIPGFSLDKFAKHSQLSATIAGIVSAKVAGDAAAHGVMSGLLHDTGKLVLATCRPVAFTQAVAQSVEQKVPLHQSETLVFGASHAEIGAYLLSLWGFPAPAIDAIAYHHRPAAPGGSGDAPGRFGLRAVVHLANALAHEAVPNNIGAAPPTGGAALPPFPANCDADYLGGLGIADRIPEWRARIREIKP